MAFISVEGETNTTAGRFLQRVHIIIDIFLSGADRNTPKYRMNVYTMKPAVMTSAVVDAILNVLSETFIKPSMTTMSPMAI